MISRIGDGVFAFESNQFNVFTQDIYGLLVKEAKASKQKRSRINFHNQNDKVHEMIICLLKNTKVAVHRHINKSESFNVIEGKLGVILFHEDTNRIKEKIVLDSEECQRYYRLNASIYHLVVPISEYVILHETTSGPFVKGDAEIPDWSLTEDGVLLLDSMRNKLVSGI